MNAVEEAYTRLRSVLTIKDRDPLQFFRHSSKQSRRATELLSRVDEVYVRAANKAGKTHWQYHVTTALLQKRPVLDGVKLPQWRGPIHAVSLERDYPTQELSSQKALLRALGDWPYHPIKQGQYLQAVRVMPFDRDTDERHWSTLTFMSQKNLNTGTGIRADLVLANEPPNRETWHEVRKAAEAGRRIIRIPCATPIKRREWYWMAEEYGTSCPRGGIEIHKEVPWAEVRWSLDDNSALTQEEIAVLKAEYRKDPALYEARVHGDYVNTEGKCPFDADTLVAMLAECREPETTLWRVTIESLDGTPSAVTKVPVQVWKEPERGKTYYLDVDPASGVDDGQHNPAGIQVAEQGSGDLVARWNGYLAPYSVGILAGGLSRQYNEAGIDIETNDHWGVNVVRGVNACRMGGRLLHERRELRPGHWAKEAGYRANEESRAVWIGHIQEWLSAWKSGVKYAACPSRAVLECLLDAELDDRGKIVAGPGSGHGEDMVLWGQKLRRAVSRSNREIPDLQQPAKTPDQILADKIMGRSQNGTHEVIRRPKPRPRV